MNTDFAGGPQNGVLKLKAFAKNGQVTNRVMWCNVVFEGLLWLDGQIWNKPDTALDGTIPNQTHPCMVAMSVLLKYVPLFIHGCKPHAYRTMEGWTTSKDRPPQVRHIGPAIVNVFKHLANTMLSDHSVSRAAVLLAYINNNNIANYTKLRYWACIDTRLFSTAMFYTTAGPHGATS